MPSLHRCPMVEEIQKKKGAERRPLWQSPAVCRDATHGDEKEGGLGQQRHHGLAGDVGLRQQARHSTGKATAIEGLAQA